MAETIRHIIQSGRNMLRLEQHCYLPTDEALGQTLRKNRRNANQQQMMRVTMHGDEFLRYEDDNMYIFAAESDLRFLANSKHWFGDGTFKITPNGFYQQYTLHAFFDGKTYPCVYALLPGKSRQIYTKMLDVIMQLMPYDVFANPESIMTDFEIAAMNAFRDRFPDAEISGCYFHLGQSIWRKIQNLSLDARYGTDKAFAIRVRRFMALAFVPPHQVHHYMRLILLDEAHINDGALTAFAKYFKDTYVGDEFFVPVFPHTTWNMYDRIKADLPRTNNTVEAWHGAFANDIANHPGVIPLSEKYKKEQHNQAMVRAQHVADKGETTG